MYLPRPIWHDWKPPGEVKLVLDPNVPTHKTPIVLKDSIKQELDKMEKHRVIRANTWLQTWCPASPTCTRREVTLECPFTQGTSTGLWRDHITRPPRCYSWLTSSQIPRSSWSLMPTHGTGQIEKSVKFGIEYSQNWLWNSCLSSGMALGQSAVPQGHWNDNSSLPTFSP